MTMCAQGKYEIKNVENKNIDSKGKFDRKI